MNKQGRLGIGALARATGIHTNTIRTWERRYGVPQAERTSGGHRTYNQEVVVHLNLVRKALKLGHRPSSILALSTAQLTEMVYRVGPSPVASMPAALGQTNVEGNSHPWMGAVLSLDGDALDRLFHSSLADGGVLQFLEFCVTPFLVSLGEGWAAGRVDIYHEHFASERLTSFLGAQWRKLSTGSSGPVVVLACFPQEHHNCGLHMAAWILARRGWRVVFVGSDCPIPDIVAAVRNTGASTVAVSVSIFAPEVETRRHLQQLLQCTETTRVVLGGLGAVSHKRVVSFSDLSELDGWACRSQQT